HTMRAGQWPKFIPPPTKAEAEWAEGGSTLPPPSRMKKAVDQHALDLSVMNSRTCTDGHVGSFIHAGVHGVVCRDCLDAGIPANEQDSYPWCKNGHIEWRFREKSNRRECVACSRVRKFSTRYPEESARMR